MSKNPEREAFGISDEEFTLLLADECIRLFRDSKLLNAALVTEGDGRARERWGIPLDSCDPFQTDAIFGEMMTEVCTEMLTRFMTFEEA